MYSDYEISDTENTLSDRGSETPTDKPVVLSQKEWRRRQKTPEETKINNKSANGNQRNNITTTNNKKQRVNKENQSYSQENITTLLEIHQQQVTPTANQIILLHYRIPFLKKLQIKKNQQPAKWWSSSPYVFPWIESKIIKSPLYSDSWRMRIWCCYSAC